MTGNGSYMFMVTKGPGAPDNLHMFKLEHESATLLCKMKMRFMLYLWHRDVGPGPLGCFKHGSSYWIDIHVATLLVACGGFGGGGGGVGGAVMTFLIVRSWCSLRVDTLCTVRGTWVNSLAATRLMVHVHEATYVLIRCALFVVHELMLLLLSSSWFMYMKWHTCWFAVHSSWHMSWCFCCYPPHGSCTWSDIRVDLLCTLRGTWVEIVDSLERSKPINCEHGAKASYVTVWRHASMACPTHSCSAKHINMYGKRTMSTSCWPRNWKMERRKLWSKKCVGDDGVHNPMQIPLKVCFGPVLMEFRCHFPTNYRCSQNIARVEKTMAGCCWKCWFRQGPRAPVLPCLYHL